MLLAKQIVEECVNVEAPHPALQSDGILLHFLDRLAFIGIGRLDTEIECKLIPSLDFLGIEKLDQLEQAEYFELLIIAFWWVVECPSQLRLVNVRGKRRVAVQDERNINVRDVCVSDRS